MTQAEERTQDISQAGVETIVRKKASRFLITQLSEFIRPAEHLPLSLNTPSRRSCSSTRRLEDARAAPGVSESTVGQLARSAYTIQGECDRRTFRTTVTRHTVDHPPSGSF